MNVRTLSLALVALAAFAAPALAEDPPKVAATPRGQMLEFSDARVRLEAIQDARDGSVTLRSVADADGQMPSGDLAPVIVLADKSEIRATRVPGEPVSWRFNDARLKSGLTDAARVRITSSGRPSEIRWVVAPAPGALPADDDSLAPPTEREPMGRIPGPAPRYGGTVIVGNGSAFEIVRAPDTVTVYALDPAGRPLELTQAPSLVLETADGPRVLALSKVEATPGVWRSATLADLPEGNLAGRLEFVVAGRSQTIALAQPPAAGELGVHQGVLTFGGAVNVRVTCDENRGTIRLEPASPRDAQAIQGAPTIVVAGPAAQPRTVALKAVGGEPTTAWEIQDPNFFEEGTDVRVRVNVGGRSHEESLSQFLANAEGGMVAAGANGGQVVRFEGAPAIEVLRDPANGTLTAYLVRDPNATTMVALDGAPEVRITTASGPRSFVLVPVTGQTNVWRVSAAELRGERLDGTMHIRFQNRTFQSALPLGGPAPAASPMKAPCEVGR